MSDKYQEIVSGGVGKTVATKLGLPRPAILRRYKSGTNLVALSPDLREAFPDSAAVNHALRELLKISKKMVVRERPARAYRSR